MASKTSNTVSDGSAERIEKYRITIAELQRTNQVLSQAVQNLSSEAEALRNWKGKTQALIGQENGRIEELIRRLEIAKESLQAERDITRTLQRELRNRDDEKETLEREQRILKLAIQELEVENQRLTRELERKQSEGGEALTRLNADLTAKELAISALRATNDDLNRTVLREMDEKRILAERCAGFEESLRALDADSQQSVRRISEMEANESLLRAEILQLRTSFEERRGTEERLRGEISTLRGTLAENASQEDGTQVAQEELEALRSELAASEKIKKALWSELIDLQRAITASDSAPGASIPASVDQAMAVMAKQHGAIQQEVHAKLAEQEKLRKPNELPATPPPEVAPAARPMYDQQP